MTSFDKIRKDYLVKLAKRIQELRTRGYTMEVIAQRFHISRMSAYRYLKHLPN